MSASDLLAIDRSREFHDGPVRQAWANRCYSIEGHKLQAASDVLYSIILDRIRSRFGEIRADLVKSIAQSPAQDFHEAQLYTYYSVFWRESKRTYKARQASELKKLPPRFHNDYTAAAKEIYTRIRQDGLDTCIRVQGTAEPSDWYGYRNGEDASHYRYDKIDPCRLDRIFFTTDISPRLALHFGSHYWVKVDRTIYDDTHPDFRVFECTVKLQFYPRGIGRKYERVLLKTFKKYQSYTPFKLNPEDVIKMLWGGSKASTRGPIPTTQAIVSEATAWLQHLPPSEESSSYEDDDETYRDEDNISVEDDIEGFTMSSVFANR